MSLPESLLRVRQAYPHRQITLGDAQWHVRDTDSNRPDRIPLFLLPGAMGTGDVFYHLLAELGTQHRLITVDYPCLPNAAQIAESFIALLDALAIPKADILGSSVGGYVAQMIALAQPNRVRKLALANTFCDPSLQQKKWPPAAEYALIPTPEILAAARAQLEAGPDTPPEKGALKSLMLSLVGNDQSAEHVRAMRLAVLTGAQLAPLALAHTDIALIDDDGDPVIAAPAREELRERYRASQHIRIPGGEHFPMNLRPDAYLEAVKKIFFVEPSA